MSFNLIDTVKGHTDGQLLGQMSQLLGEESANAGIALDSAVPAMLSGLLGTTRTSKGADSLFSAVQDHDDQVLDNLGAMLSSGKASAVIENGNSVLGELLGRGGLGKLAGVLSTFTGLSRGGTGSLIGMLTPVIMGVLKRKVSSEGLNSANLARLFSDQAENFTDSMPEGLGTALNSSGFLGSITDSISSTATNLASTTVGAIGGSVVDAAHSVSEVKQRVSSGVTNASARGGELLDDAKSLGADVRGDISDAMDNAGGAARRGIQNASDSMSTVADASLDQAHDVVRTGTVWTKLLAPLLIIGLLAWAGYMFYLSQQSNSVAAAESATTAD